MEKTCLEQSPNGLFWTVLNRPEIWVGNSGYGRFGPNCQEFQTVWENHSELVLDGLRPNRPELIIFFSCLDLFIYFIY